MSERWATRAEAGAAERRFADALPGWRTPAAHGVGRADGERIEFVRIGASEDSLAAVVLATVAGHRGGSASYRLDVAGLRRAIDLLASAEADREAAGQEATWQGGSELPELNVWRWLAAGLSDGDLVVVAFAEDLAPPAGDPGVDALVGAALAGREENPDGTTTLWRPVGPGELRLIELSGRRAFPPRLPDQPIFYPVLNAEYAARIAREWNVPASGAGFVTRFRVGTPFARRYPSRRAGGGGIVELWVPAEDLDELNAHLVGLIEVVAEYGRE